MANLSGKVLPDTGKHAVERRRGPVLNPYGIYA